MGINKHNGAMLVLAGADACGKDTQAERLRDRLVASGRPARVTREPSDGPHGVQIRRLLAGPTGAGWVGPSTLEMALLFAADRAGHVREMMRWVAAGEVVVCTRYIESSIVYQGHLLSLEVDRLGRAASDPYGWLRAVNGQFPGADVTIVLDVDPARAERRLASRGDRDVYERNAALQVAVAEKYTRLEEFIGSPVAHVRGDGTVDEVAEGVWSAAQAALGALGPGNPSHWWARS